jgi:hypothetical protein
MRKLPKILVRSHRAILVSAVAVAAIWLTAAAFALDARSVERDLPRSYSGWFGWDRGGDRQQIDIRLESVSVLDDTTIEAVGCGRYDAAGSVTGIRVRMRIEVPSLAVEIFEFSAVGAADFVTDGSHVGQLSEDLRAIAAEWTTRSSGEKGRLGLRAGASLPCPAKSVRLGSGIAVARGAPDRN